MTHSILPFGRGQSRASLRGKAPGERDGRDGTSSARRCRCIRWRTRSTFTAAEQTCEDWTASGEGSAIVGHHDRMGLRDDAPSKSWNSSHPTRGCGQEALQGTGGDGLFYCFASN